MLAAPQFIKNYGNGSTTGMSIFMVLGWLCGDLFKVIYFYLLRNGSKSITVHCYPVKTFYTLVQFKMTSQFRTRSATSFLGLGRGIVERCFVNGGASFRWSFGPLLSYSCLTPAFQKIRIFQKWRVTWLSSDNWFLPIIANCWPILNDQDEHSYEWNNIDPFMLTLGPPRRL